MVELNSADYSLLSWVQQSEIPAHALSIRFLQGSLIVQCETLEQAAKLWETQSILQMPERELCFRVNDTLYVGALMAR